MTAKFFLRLALAVALISVAPLAARAADITVFAAASLKNALDDIGAAWQLKSGHSAAISYAASSVLARQIEASGGADVFVSADTDWMNELADHGLIRPASRRDLLGNRLVLIEPASAHLEITIKPRFLLAAALSGGRLAVADPQSVPAGKYAKAALTFLGVWDKIARRLAPAENVRAALAYVARGEAPLGIVYMTDALSEPAVRIAGVFPDETHPPIVYPIALTKDAKPFATSFLAFVESREAAGVFRKYGFIVPEPKHR